MLRAFLERADDAIIKRFDAVLLLLADLGLGLNDTPEFRNIILDLLHVGGLGDDIVRARHLLDVRLELADVLTNDLGVDDLALSGDLGLGRGREGD